MLGDGYHDVPAGKLAMVVTHLQMMAAAPLRGAVLPQGLRFEPLARDLDTYKDLFRRVGQDWLWFGRLTMPENELAGILDNPDVALFTLTKDGVPEALLELDFRQSGECELAYFGLSATLIGTGAGAYLMDRAIEAAWAHTITRFHVHTCTLDSPQALDFYVRSGFAAYKRQIEISDDPRLTGVVPRDVYPRMPIT